MKILILLLLTIPSYCFAQKDSFKEIYLNNIHVDIGEFENEKYLDVNFLEKPIIENMFGDPRFGGYYLDNFADTKTQNELLEINNKQQLHDAYLQRLENDSLFNKVVKDYYDKAVSHVIPKDTFTLNEMLNVAVKFFALTNISVEGKYSTHICSGINEVAATAKTRFPALEAFVFSSIQNNLTNPKYKLMTDFRESLYKLDDIGLGVSSDEKLLRSQGALFVYMKQSLELQRMLSDEYLHYKRQLPFILSKESNQQ